MTKINRKTRSLRNAGLPLARASHYAKQDKGLPAWAMGGLILAFVGTVGVLSVTALGLTQDETQTAVAVPTEAELETLQQTASAIETITAARVAPAVAPVPVVDAVAALAAITDVPSGNAPEIVTRQTTSVLNDLLVEPTSVDAGCMGDLVTLLNAKTIPFAISSTDVDLPQHDDVRAIAASARDCSDVRIVVEGHSDASGSDYVNIQLSWSRAEAVIALIAEMGFDTSIYEPMGFGARFAPELTDGATPTDDSRRVSFRLIPQVQTTAVSN